MSRQSDDSRGGRKWGAPQETDETRGVSNEGLLSLQQKKMQDQDDALDILGQSIARTKEIAITIGKEADEHNQLITEIDSHVDRTNAKVKNTTRRVERVERKARTKGMWATICVLFLIL
eukprot:CAMPEP_0168570010 /NCGR_PEP_ID=MMETSP0413-20121227/16488_1 /TAXON_ID=136452 /ORGANISM="Filamoeba nolandi, Strain NC-AS-23-1" /LENGTH=118 /DNA_ID=CAMNT_0008602595 /DNA_START=101 /DNA_END=454 /DNA_ORIENTATION=-